MTNCDKLYSRDLHKSQTKEKELIISEGLIEKSRLSIEHIKQLRAL